MSDVTANEVARARANRLYWSSPDTVDEIAAELGMGRSALYSAIRPASAAADCPRCGAGLVFANRSARAAGRARCPECGATQMLGESAHPSDRVREPAAESPRAPRRAASARPAPAPAPATREIGRLTSRREWGYALSAVERGRLMMIGGAAALGIAAGVAAVEIVRARR
jgi:ribosomal protein S27AE